jgi:hypothetical protein
MTRKKPMQSGREKIRWVAVGTDNLKTGRADGQLSGNTVYQLRPSQAGWQAIYIDSKNKTTTVLARDVSRNAAYYTASHHHHWDGDKPLPTP